MSQASRSDDRSRTGALWCGWISLVGAGLPLLLLLLLTLATTGASRMVTAIPLVILHLTWWLWLGLGFIAVILALQSRRSVAPLVVALTAVAASIVGAIWGLQMQM